MVKRTFRAMQSSLLALALMAGAAYAEILKSASPSTNSELPYHPGAKKLIEYGWDIPTATYVRDHIRQMQKRPFDGLRFQIGGETQAFEQRPWQEAEMKLDVLGKIKWGRFSDNFLLILGQSDPSIDWFDDGAWETISDNMRLLSRALKAGRCTGVFFDPEWYDGYGDHSPWVYDRTIYPDHTFAEVQAAVRERGSQFMAALQSDMPALRFLSFYLLGEVASECLDAPLQDTGFALLPSFLDGMLDSAGPDVVFIDGNEGAYYHDETRKYSEDYDWIRNHAADLLAPENRERYGQVQVGMAVYTDLVYALWPEYQHGWSDEYKRAWFEHNIYQALFTSDQYVWCYGEKLDWWRRTGIPNGAERVARTARDEFHRAEALGFDMVKTTDDYWDDTVQARLVQSPVPIIDSPIQGATYPAEEPILIRATIAEGTADEMEFYINSLLVGIDDGDESDTAFQLSVPGLPSGSYTLMIRAVMEDGSHVTSGPRDVCVQ